ncbi:helix-turn-helix transcriptional regulator [Thalassospira xianhensis]|uniref:PadR family transcriptional regulator n=1 Tax=Thalassospira xianhensis TaxID=478503 RepID=UPI000DEDDAEB|nr:PadR family transcriptional regulator [Thalassospira xianhensis]
MYVFLLIPCAFHNKAQGQASTMNENLLPKVSAFEFSLLMAIRVGGTHVDSTRLTRVLFGDATGREIPTAQVYAALQRLEQDGMISSRETELEPEPIQGEKSERLYELTVLGQETLEDSFRNIRQFQR